jgi:hypothetical protein
MGVPLVYLDPQVLLALQALWDLLGLRDRLGLPAP